MAGSSEVNASAAQPRRRTIPLISTNTYIPCLGRYINGTCVNTQVVPWFEKLHLSAYQIRSWLGWSMPKYLFDRDLSDVDSA